MTPAEAPPPDEPKVPLWRNPFVIAFVVGAFFLTALPFMQRRFLKAPPPGPSLGAWSGTSSDGGAFGADQLKGQVWIASFAGDPAGRAEFGTILKHTADVPGIVLVSFVAAGEGHHIGGDQWHVVQAPDALALQQFRPAFVAFSKQDGGATLDDWRRVPTLAVVDQNGALRGFWPDTALGRGNAINAARLLARYGATP